MGVHEAAVGIVDALQAAENACALPGLLTARLGLQEVLQRFIDASGLPFATMFADKSVLDLHQHAHMGMYNGKLMDEDFRSFVESCDRVVCVGTLMTHFNSGAFTASLDPDRLITIDPHHCAIGSHVYPNVELADPLQELTERISQCRPMTTTPQPTAPAEIAGAGDNVITAEALYPRWERFLLPR